MRDVRRGVGLPAALDDTFADLDDSWSEEFPNLYGSEYEPIPRDHIFKLAPDSAPVPCEYGDDQIYEITYENTVESAAGAWYPTCDILIYNTAGVSSFYEGGGGAFGVASLFAHEWGHAIQDRAGTFSEAGRDRGASWWSSRPTASPAASRGISPAVMPACT